MTAERNRIGRACRRTLGAVVADGDGACGIGECLGRTRRAGRRRAADGDRVRSGGKSLAAHRGGEIAVGSRGLAQRDPGRAGSGRGAAHRQRITAAGYRVGANGRAAVVAGRCVAANGGCIGVGRGCTRPDRRGVVGRNRGRRPDSDRIGAGGRPAARRIVLRMGDVAGERAGCEDCGCHGLRDGRLVRLAPCRIVFRCRDPGAKGFVPDRAVCAVHVLLPPNVHATHRSLFLEDYSVRSRESQN